MSAIKSAIIVLGIASAIAMGACTTKPIMNVRDAPVVSAKPLQAAQVRQAIITAGVALGWQVTDVKPGTLEATLNLREHTAIVEIPYTTSTYSIVYKRGANLGEREGQIHKNYNGWVQNLDTRIKAELSKL
ncbi:MAG: hypothetical protein ABI905_03445 [Betaproteobacteria bacterium]